MVENLASKTKACGFQGRTI